MKKILTVSAVAVLISTTVLAQADLSFGLRAGINFQNINGKESDGDKLKNTLSTGFNAGVNAEFPIGVDFYLQPGVIFSQKGAKLKNYEYMDQVFNGNLKLSYVEIPVNLEYKPLLGNGRMIIGFGPYIGFGVGGKAELNNPSSDYEVEFKKDVSSADLNNTPFHYKPMDGGANIFAGYEFSNKLSFQLNTQLGLTKINSTVNGSNTGEAAHRNTGFGFSLGYRF